MRLTLGAIQLTSTTDVGSNLARAVLLVREAAQRGAELVVLPENYGFLGPDEERLKHAQDVNDGPFTAPLRDLAREKAIWVLAGSIPERTSDPRRTFNTSVLIGPDGNTRATYRKIHLFDVDLADGSRFEESNHVVAGREPVVAEAAGWTLGFSVCYDLRFPELYRQLVGRGARLISVPSAFTLHTGKDHWEPLIRARAIENQCYVIASAQHGRHSASRASWGKSMIVDPWGTVIATAGEREQAIVAVADSELQDQVRRELPSLGHRRLS